MSALSGRGLVSAYRSRKLYALPVAVGLVLAINLLCVWLALSQPYVGARVAPAPDVPGVRITGILAGGPFDQAGLAVGDVLVAVDRPGRDVLALSPELGLPDPDFAASQGAVHALLHDSGVLAEYLRGGDLQFSLASGRTVLVKPGESRTLVSLITHDSFLAPLLFGNIAFTVGILLWVYGRSPVIPHLLLFAGTTNALILWSAAIIWSRELVLTGPVFWGLFLFNQFGAIFYPVSMFALLLIYPTQLVRWTIVRWVFVFATGLWIHAIAPIADLPFQWMFAFVLVMSLAAMPVILAQWRATRKRPIERAQASLMAFSCLLLAVGVLAIYVLPIALTGKSLGGSLSLSGLMTILPFFGFAIGVARYRLFDLPRWWFSASVWFLSGLLIVTVELAIFVFVGTHHITSLAIATLAVGWIYFPLRQALFDFVFRTRRYAVHDVLPAYLKRLSEARSRTEFDTHLAGEAARLFTPAAIAQVEQSDARVTIGESGLVLTLPAATPGRAIRLEGAANATRLFNRRDVALAEMIVDLTRRYRAQIEAIETSISAERRRIARDLHDTVGAKMVSLIHGAPGTNVAGKARDACRALIDTIWLLRSDEDQPLAIAVSKWAEEMRERADDARIALAWHNDDVREIRLPAQVIVNLGNILREALSNTIRHSEARKVSVDISRTDRGRLLLSVLHDGAPVAPADWRRGFGLQGIEERVSEMGGTVEWTETSAVADGVVMRVSVPVDRGAGGRNGHVANAAD